MIPRAAGAQPIRRAIHRRMRRTFRWAPVDRLPLGELLVLTETETTRGGRVRHAGWASVVARSGGRQLVAEYRW